MQTLKHLGLWILLEIFEWAENRAGRRMAWVRRQQSILDIWQGE